jgi:ubiquitin C-terminal hydrolase
MEKIEYNYDFHKYYSLHVAKKNYITRGLSGLMNQGNTCFMNSIIQCLSNTLSLTDYILTNKIKADIKSRSVDPRRYILISYMQLVQQIWNENQVIRPKSFFENISNFHKKYFSLQQQDAHEFLLYLLDILHETISYPIEVEISGEIKNDHDSLMKKSLETWKKFYENSYSYIIELFNGSTINKTECHNCGAKNIIFESYNTLNLDIISKHNLYECLDMYFNTDNVRNWKCEKCNKIGECNKMIGGWTFPDYLIINLKRGITNKDTSFIDFPIKDLNLTKYNSNSNSNNYIYDLYAVCNHSGNMMSGGHYYSYCKNLDGDWYEFNDANVSRFKSNVKVVSSDATILFYQRKKIYKRDTLLI